MTHPSRLESVLLAADPIYAQAVCDALMAAGIDARAVCEDDGAALDVFVPAESAPRARQIIRDGNWPRLA